MWVFWVLAEGEGKINEEEEFLLAKASVCVCPCCNDKPEQNAALSKGLLFLFPFLLLLAG